MQRGMGVEARSAIDAGRRLLLHLALLELTPERLPADERLIQAVGPHVARLLQALANDDFHSPRPRPL